MLSRNLVIDEKPVKKIPHFVQLTDTRSLRSWGKRIPAVRKGKKPIWGHTGKVSLGTTLCALAALV